MGIPMDTKADSGFNHTPAEASFVRGGPFYRAQQALGLIHPNKWNLGRRIAVVIVITWLPLFVLTARLNPQGLNFFAAGRSRSRSTAHRRASAVVL
jgi:hypothetical protein